MALTKIDDRGLKTPIDLLDSEKIRFGTGNDLEIYHDGSNSYIKDVGTGFLSIQGSEVLIRSDSDEKIIHGIANGRVELYYDNSKKLETNSAGVAITGELGFDAGGTYQVKLSDNQKIRFGASADLQIYHDGSNSYIKDTGTGRLLINGSGVRINSADNSENMIHAEADGPVELYYDNSKKLNTHASGIEILGTLYMADNKKIELGNSQDFQIYHDGTHNILLGVNGADFQIKDADHKSAIFDTSAGVELFYDNNKKFETTSTGAILTSGAANTTSVRFGNTANRGLEIKTYQSAGNNDGGVILNAADTTTSGYHAVIAFQTGGEEKARFEGQYDNFRLSNTCSGITFNGDWAAQNRLNDYEEGSFTVGFWASSTNFTTAPTLTTNNGRYTKIGNQVTFSVNVAWSNNAAGAAGNIYMSNLPFTQACVKGKLLI